MSMLPSVIIDHSLAHTFGGSPGHLYPCCEALQHRRRQRHSIPRWTAAPTRGDADQAMGRHVRPSSSPVPVSTKNRLSRAGSRYLHKARAR